MSDILQEICQKTQQDLQKQKDATPIEQLKEKVGYATKPRGFLNALKQKKRNGQYGLIAEIKKASPSHGEIRSDFNPADHARSYEKAGAACLSVLTNAPYFQGCDEDLIRAREACSLPVLRKDFMLDPYQVFEARLMGADCILLIMAALSANKAKMLEKLAFDLGMDVLVEVHNAEECETALTHLKTPLIGINNRNLKTLITDLQTSYDLCRMIPDTHHIVSESGLRTNEDLARMKACDINSFLIGESLMREEDLYQTTYELLNG